MDRETAADLLGLFHSPIKLMVHGLWDSRARILAGEIANETQGAYRKGTRFDVFLSGPPTIYEDI